MVITSATFTGNEALSVSACLRRVCGKVGGSLARIQIIHRRADRPRRVRARCMARRRGLPGVHARRRLQPCARVRGVCASRPVVGSVFVNLGGLSEANMFFQSIDRHE